MRWPASAASLTGVDLTTRPVCYRLAYTATSTTCTLAWRATLQLTNSASTTCPISPHTTQTQTIKLCTCLDCQGCQGCNKNQHSTVSQPLGCGTNANASAPVSSNNEEGITMQTWRQNAYDTMVSASLKLAPKQNGAKGPLNTEACVCWRLQEAALLYTPAAYDTPCGMFINTHNNTDHTV